MQVTPSVAAGTVDIMPYGTRYPDNSHSCEPTLAPHDAGEKTTPVRNTKRTSATEREIPLFLIPQVIVRQIRKRGGSVYRISVKRTHRHHYNITVRTKRMPRELVPGTAALFASQAGLEETGKNAVAGEHRWSNR
jgi:hypothetical protein